MKAADGSIMNEEDLAGPMVLCYGFLGNVLLLAGAQVTTKPLKSLQRRCHCKAFSADGGDPVELPVQHQGGYYTSLKTAACVTFSALASILG
ncbi:hypothetical protein GN956_G112 [Arapaima gigas]